MSDLSKWSNLARLVYLRTYSRKVDGLNESWERTVQRVLRGNIEGKEHMLDQGEAEKLERYMLDRKAMPAGRGLWFSGAPSHARLGGAALNNCYSFTLDNWSYLPIIQDYLMLGGGVGASVEHRYVSRLPHVMAGVVVTHSATKDADFIVPDSREGWCELTRRVLESFLVTGRQLTYSTICIRGAGESIHGFGGTSSGPLPLIAFITKLSTILTARAGKHIRPIDAADIVCAIGEMVVAGNVRRSAIILMGDPWDKEYLTAKRWDLGQLPTQRAMANWSVVCSSTDELHPLFWATYQQGEPFGIVNRSNIQRYGRMGEEKFDPAVVVNPCAEATLENGEPCNLQEIAMHRLDSVSEFTEAALLMHRWGKRVTMEHYHHPLTQEVISRNRRVGTGITGCLGAPGLFRPDVLDEVYAAIQEENTRYSRRLGIPDSIRTTVVKPSGTLSKVMECPWAAGIHGAYSQYIIQRVRFSAADPLLLHLRAAGHPIEPVIRFDGTLDQSTMVVSFYEEAPESVPTTNGGYDTWQQLDTLLMAQKHWADQAVSVTVYYKRDEIPELRAWLEFNLDKLKTISFLCHSDHGFLQAPWEAISAETFRAESTKIKPLDYEGLGVGDGLLDLECAGGVCPVR